jgi:hypothetical protein
MRWLLSALVMGLLVLSVVTAAAQSVDRLFGEVSQSVVVIRAKGREISAGRGLAGFTETGSGVGRSTATLGHRSDRCRQGGLLPPRVPQRVGRCRWEALTLASANAMRLANIRYRGGATSYRALGGGWQE